ncbi:MAG: hypothetical protein M1828_005128 [Chrysothrix sp. TS-e1954]|nr:MAG: hypothetical protein M1828_005128 [Chrysothrix sp. TS-e1954]
MSASPAPVVAVPSQKRPLEEPSSDAGPGDQPDAKRPALDREDGVNGQKSTATDPPVSAQTPDLDSTVKVEGGANGTSAAPSDAGAAEPATSAIPSAATVLETQPIQSTMSGTATRSGSVSTNFPHGHQDESGWLHIRAIISSAEAATCIGKGGENVTLIRKMSGAKCTVSDYSRGAVERVLTVSGLVDAVAKAFGLIIRTLNSEPLEEPSSAQSKTYPLRLLIPHILIGSIIGQKGVRIREIQEASGARLNASDACLPLSTERSLVVLGVADAVHIATYYVGSTLVEQLTERFGGPNASAYATRTGGPAGVVPGGMQVVPYTPQPGGGQWGHPDSYRKQGHAQAQRPAPNSYGPQYGHSHGHGQQSYHQSHHQQQAPVHLGGNQRGYSGAGPHQPQQYNQQAQQMPMQAGQAMPQQQGPAFAGQPLTQQIYIPNDMVGAIIGKGGAKINEIRTLSNSVIKINEPQDNSNERLVTITGTQECNQMALYMLYQRLGNVCWRSRFDVTNVKTINVVIISIFLEKGMWNGKSQRAKILLGPSESPRLVPRELLTAVSPFFQAALNGTFAEGLSQELRLPEDRPDVFDYFLYWLYTRRLDHEAVDAVEPIKPAYFWLLHLYCLVDKLGVEACKNAIIEKVVGLAEATNSVPTPTDTWIVWETFGNLKGNPMRRLITDLFAWKRTDNLVDQHEDDWHPRFMRDLCVRLRREDTKREPKPWVTNMCRYHEHVKGERCD